MMSSAAGPCIVAGAPAILLLDFRAALGFEIGPSLTRCERWQAAVAKFSSRAAAYAQAGVAASLSLAHYETHMLPT